MIEGALIGQVRADKAARLSLDYEAGVGGQQYHVFAANPFKLQANVDADVPGAAPNPAPSSRRCCIGESCRAVMPAAIVGTGERQARRVVSALIDRRVLASESTRAPLRLSFPAALASRWMPGLFPDRGA